MTTSPVRVYIGSGEASALERKTLIYSLKKNTKRPLDIHVFNGTHNSIEHNDQPPQLAPMSLRVKYTNFTEFSLYRWLIPQLCNHEGRAIFLDSDTICLGDIGELFDTPMNGAAMMCIKAYDTGEWGPSVLLLDCAKCRFDLEQILDEIEVGKYSYSEFTRLAAAYLAIHPHEIGELDQKWNTFDRYDDQTKIIHYTDLMRQPWRHDGHPFGDLWFRYFREAIDNGYVAESDIHKATLRGYARLDIRDVSQRAAQAASKNGHSRAAANGQSAGGTHAKRPHWWKTLPKKLLKSR
jgi:lipopolysaccharide biosynthesis glycosyltransferase